MKPLIRDMKTNENITECPNKSLGISNETVLKATRCMKRSSHFILKRRSFKPLKTEMPCMKG